MNETENMVIEEMNEVNDVELIPAEGNSTSGGSALGTLLKVGVGLGVAAIGVAVVKSTKKFKEWQFNRACKLVESSGYELVPSYDITEDCDAVPVEESAE